MFLTVKQAIEFLKTVEENKVSDHGYLPQLIQEKRKEVAQRQIYQLHFDDLRQQTLLIGSNAHNQSNKVHESFNLWSNPNDREQSLVVVKRGNDLY